MRFLAFRICLAFAITACLYQAIILATTCTPVNLSPAICHPAHSVAPSQSPSGGDCRVNTMGACVPTSHSDCEDRYAQAVAGQCEILLNYSNPTGCIQDSGVTVVDLSHYTAACSSDSGTCKCEYTLDTMTSPAQVQVCDCDEYAL